MEPQPRSPRPDHDASVVVSTNGDAARLRFALEGLSRQSAPPVSVHVINDGPADTTRAVCEHWSERVAFPLTHTWHPDRSEQRGAPGRRAVRESPGSELLFLNANCIPHSRWVADHLTAAERCDVRCGRRVKLGPELTLRVLTGDAQPRQLESPVGPTFKAALTGDTQSFGRALRLPQFAARLLHRHPRRLKAFNFSVSRAAFESVNGFELNWYGRRDDRELEVRLQGAGFTFMPLINRAIVYSLFRVGELRRTSTTLIPARRAARNLRPAVGKLSKSRA